MAVKIDEKIIEDVTVLAKLNLSEDEIEEIKEDMIKMLEYVDKLKKLDTEKAEPMYQIFSTNNIFRDDVVKNKDDREEILANAPERENDTIVVPKTIN